MSKVKYCFYLTDDDKCSCREPLECSLSKLLECPATNLVVDKEVDD